MILANTTGIYVYTSDPLIENNIISGNQTAIYVQGSGCGGSELCGGVSPVIKNNSITNNKMNTINVNNFLSKAKNSPFDGNQILGVVTKTIINGQVVFDGKKIIASPGTGRVLEKEVDF